MHFNFWWRRGWAVPDKKTQAIPCISQWNGSRNDEKNHRQDGIWKLPPNLWLGHCNWGYRPDYIVIATLTGQEQVEFDRRRSEVWTGTAADMISKDCSYAPHQQVSVVWITNSASCINLGHSKLLVVVPVTCYFICFFPWIQIKQDSATPRWLIRNLPSVFSQTAYSELIPAAALNLQQLELSVLQHFSAQLPPGCSLVLN